MLSLKKWLNLFIIFHVLAATPIFSLSDHSSNQLSTNFLEIAKKPDVFDWMVKIRRKIHENPELGYEEFETSKLIRDELDKLGIPYKYPVAVTGVIGYIGTGNSPFVAIRADMDALPVQEMVEWEHKSKVPGKMHACGHDAHVAMLLGAAKILKQHEKQLQLLSTCGADGVRMALTAPGSRADGASGATLARMAPTSSVLGAGGTINGTGHARVFFKT